MRPVVTEHLNACSTWPRFFGGSITSKQDWRCTATGSRDCQGGWQVRRKLLLIAAALLIFGYGFALGIVSEQGRQQFAEKGVGHAR